MAKIWADIITIGDEILYGQIIDTNAQWLCEHLSAIGVEVRKHITIRDIETEINKQLSRSASKVDLVITTGGLGPTKDDLTKNIIANFVGEPLIEDSSAVEDVEAYLSSKGRPLSDLNRKQALVPKGTKIIHNYQGTAPGMWIEYNDTLIVAMPGVPHEMKSMMKVVFGELKPYFDLPIIKHKMIKLIGIGESWLSELIAPWENALPNHIRLAYLPAIGQMRLRLTLRGDDGELMEKDLQYQIDALIKIAGQYIYGYDDDTIESIIAQLLIEGGKTIATAESCSGGQLGQMIVSVAGSSAYYKGGVIAYNNEQKIKMLHVEKMLIDKHGAVSESVAKEMALGVQSLMGTDYALATTGIAGPDGGTVEKPVGTIWIACAYKENVEAVRLSLGDNRLINMQSAAIQSLNLLREIMLENI